MNKKWKALARCLTALLTVLGASLVAAAGQSAPVASLIPGGFTTGGVAVPPRPIHPFLPGPIPTPHALQVKGQFYSANWGGFIDGARASNSQLSADGAQFAAVGSSWAVPSLQKSPPNSYEASWDGVGGVFGTQALLQAGSMEYFSGPRQNYLAFVEDYPNPALQVDAPVRAGDALSASVWLSGGIWYVQVTDRSQGWTTGPVNIAAVYAGVGYPFVAPDQESAEWIVEDPTCGGSLCAFANFTAESFSAVQDSAAVAVTRTPLQAIIVDAQGTPQVAVSPSNIGTATAASASYASFMVTRTGTLPGGPVRPGGLGGPAGGPGGPSPTGPGR